VIHKGAMSAVVGLNIDQVNAIVAECAQSGIVAVANHNSAEQIVITGEPAAVQTAAEKAASQGARAIALKVSGAWHSPLIKGAEAEFQSYLDGIEFHAPTCKVFHNVTAEAAPDPDQIKTLMAKQLCNPVRWYDTMMNMIHARVEVFVEIGPGKVLTGLLKKALPSDFPVTVYNVYDINSLEKFLTAL
jgi:[acyl-carrier-protein] S-malonyltransferase